MNVEEEKKAIENIKETYESYIQEGIEKHGGISALSRKLGHRHNYLTQVLKYRSITGLFNAVKQIEDLQDE